ncbi:MAG: hypothetical protein M1372_02305 [Patescibacteria group bacterium]|nr:hypothetical protein [Patescibacteria group bacterium]
MKNKKLIFYLLRTGIAIVFFYAAIAAFLEPQNWIGYLPQILRNIFPAQLLLSLFSIYELAIAMWLLWGHKIFYAASLAVLTLVGIIIANIGVLDIVFRDIAILFSALALVVFARGENN